MKKRPVVYGALAITLLTWLLFFRPGLIPHGLPPAQPSPGVVGEFETRDWRITLRQTGAGIVYYVEPKHAQVVEALPWDQFKKRYPELIRALPLATPKKLLGAREAAIHL